MPLFDYKCSHCHHITTTTNRSTVTICERCGTFANRRFSFNIAASMPGHYNPTIGQYVSNKIQFSDALKRQAESATLSLGIEHTFQPVTLHDKTAIGVTTDGLYETAKHKHDAGLQ